MTGHWFAKFQVSRKTLWEALTKDSHLSAWLDPGAKLDLRSGGKLTLPGQTQFRGMLGDVTLVEFEPEQLLTFSWPINGVPTALSLKVSGNDSTSQLDVIQTLDGEDTGRINPPRTDWGTLRHYWKQNLASLKYFLELGQAPNRNPLAARALKEVNLSFTYNHSQAKAWEAISNPAVMDQWISKKADAFKFPPLSLLRRVAESPDWLQRRLVYVPADSWAVPGDGRADEAVVEFE